jgi:hypothetical protein
LKKIVKHPLTIKILKPLLSDYGEGLWDLDDSEDIHFQLLSPFVSGISKKTLVHAS